MDIKKRLEKFNRWWAKRKLIRLNEKNLRDVSLIEEFLTDRVTKGENYRKNQLVDIQNRVEESKKMINFLKEIQ